MKNLTDYAKKRDAGAGEDGWAKLKNWKDPTAENRRLAGDTALKGKLPSYSKQTPQSKGYGISPVDGASDKTYGNLNKPGDSTA